MLRALRLALLVVALLALSGCKVIYVKTVPKDADVYVDGELIGKTPCKFKVKTFVWLDYDVEVKKEGFKPHKETIDVEYGPSTQRLALSLAIGIITAPFIIVTPFMGDPIPSEIIVPLEPDFNETPPPQTGIVKPVPK